MAKQKVIHKRIWLQPKDPYTKSYAMYTVYSNDDYGSNINIADCYRSIDLSMNSKKDRRKIQKLINFLQEAVEVWDREQE